jgi:hypothetical protein
MPDPRLLEWNGKMGSESTKAAVNDISVALHFSNL